MNQGSLRLYFLNSLTLALSFTNLEDALKIVLLLLSITYTCMKIYDWFKKIN
jgi:hypothetical protein